MHSTFTELTIWKWQCFRGCRSLLKSRGWGARGNLTSKWQGKWPLEHHSHKPRVSIMLSDFLAFELRSNQLVRNPSISRYLLAEELNMRRWKGTKRTIRLWHHHLDDSFPARNVQAYTVQRASLTFKVNRVAVKMRSLKELVLRQETINYVTFVQRRISTSSRNLRYIWRKMRTTGDLASHRILMNAVCMTW